jgi:hypothetical protein
LYDTVGRINRKPARYAERLAELIVPDGGRSNGDSRDGTRPMARTCHHRDRAQLEVSLRRAARRPTGCAVCGLDADQRALVSPFLANGAAIAWVAAHYGLSRGELRRHADGCRGAGR